MIFNEHVSEFYGTQNSTKQRCKKKKKTYHFMNSKRENCRETGNPFRLSVAKNSNEKILLHSIRKWNEKKKWWNRRELFIHLIMKAVSMVQQSIRHQSEHSFNQHLEINIEFVFVLFETMYAILKIDFKFQMHI